MSFNRNMTAVREPMTITKITIGGEGLSLFASMIAF
jgi:hypothetical protein